MNEKYDVVKDPVSKEMLKEALRELGVNNQMIVEVHSKLSAFHYVIGGARTVVDALMELTDNGGTLLMPTQVADNSEPSDWVNPPVSPSMYKEVREMIPPYDQKNSDIPNMGEVVKNFRARDGVVISNHPAVSYAAWGRYAKLLCNHQSTHFPLAEESPTARLYELKGNVLLIGADFDSTTCMHLAEYRCDCRPVQMMGVSVMDNDYPVWKKYLDLQLDSDVFMKVKTIMAKKKMIKEINVGGCPIQFFSANHAIDETVRYLEKSTVIDLYR